jgi:DNA-binding NtrC family response regulator
MTNVLPPPQTILQTILIVEDDQLLKMLTVDTVEDAGFLALEASNADEAIAILAARPDIVMLLTDVSMPGSMDGLKLAHAVHVRWPHIKIVVVSARGDISAADLPAHGRFFRKPYRADVMVSAIQSLIGIESQGSGGRIYLDV